MTRLNEQLLHFFKFLLENILKYLHFKNQTNITKTYISSNQLESPKLIDLLLIKFYKL